MLKQAALSIGIIAPSAQVPKTEFALGLARIEAAGFTVRVHPQTFASSLFFAGPDEKRARAFYEYACESDLDVLWGARGGHGAIRILPWLEKLTRKHGVPPRKKLLVGYSDATALLEFVRRRWGWSALHGPMPGMRRFCAVSPTEWASLVTQLRHGLVPEPWGEGHALRFVGRRPGRAITGPLVGGNLSMVSALAGTPWAQRSKGAIVFLEDLEETLYRVDRMAQQLLLSGILDGARALVLGDFLNCPDRSAKVLARRPAPEELRRVLTAPRPDELQPLRKELPAEPTLHKIFRDVADTLGIPLAYGLPAGHGPGYASGPIGAQVRLEPSGRLRIQSWSWARA